MNYYPPWVLGNRSTSDSSKYAGSSGQSIAGPFLHSGTPVGRSYATNSVMTSRHHPFEMYRSKVEVGVMPGGHVIFQIFSVSMGELLTLAEVLALAG